MLSSIIAAASIAFSFLTVLPMPRAEWTPQRLRYFPLALPLVGFAVGLSGMLFFIGLSHWRLTGAFRGAAAALFYLAVTGGLHMDGLMDTCDAVFSRQDREARLRILSDTHAGSFAVMGCAVSLLLKAGIFSELFTAPAAFPPLLLALVPVYSRLGLGLLFYLPFAREDGLARTLGASRVFRDRYVLMTAYALFTAAVPFMGLKWALVPLSGAVLFDFYSRCCVRTFGGITGDLMGAFVELSELLMLLALLAARG